MAPSEDEPTLVAVELKRDLDNRIQEVASQTHAYLEMLDPSGAGLREDVARSYKLVCGQLKDLGLKAPSPDLIEVGMPVVGVVALANYNPKSKLLDRALADARSLERKVHFCRIEDGDLILPPPACWSS